METHIYFYSAATATLDVSEGAYTVTVQTGAQTATFEERRSDSTCAGLELMALIRGIKEAPKNSNHYHLHTSNAYLAQVMETGAVAEWRSKSWRRHEQDSRIWFAHHWEELLDLTEEIDFDKITFEYETYDKMSEELQKCVTAARKAAGLKTYPRVKIT